MAASDHLSSEQFGHPEHWEFDVMHSSHDELKQGKVEPRRTRVLVSREEAPTAEEAEAVAAQMGIARGEYTTRVMHRL